MCPRFSPKAAHERNAVSTDLVRATAEASRFPSRETKAPPTRRPPRIHRTGRTMQFASISSVVKRPCFRAFRFPRGAPPAKVLRGWDWQLYFARNDAEDCDLAEREGGGDLHRDRAAAASPAWGKSEPQLQERIGSNIGFRNLFLHAAFLVPT
jgi:hypothetical protein